MGEQPLHLVDYDQWHKTKTAFIQCSLSGSVLGWFLRLHESHKNDRFALVSSFKKNFLHRKRHITQKSELKL